MNWFAIIAPRPIIFSLTISKIFCRLTNDLLVSAGHRECPKPFNKAGESKRHSQAENALDLNMESACLNVIRDARYKYVHFADLPCLLFDLKNDPGELTNIATTSPAIVAEYAQKLLSWRLRTTDKTLTHLQISRTDGLKNMKDE